MNTNFSMEFDYTDEAFEELEKLFTNEKEIVLNIFESSLQYIVDERRKYLDEKKLKLDQGKGIRINRKQQLEKWDNQQQVYFQRNVPIKMHPTQSEILFFIARKFYNDTIKSIYLEEKTPYDNIKAHEFLRQEPILFSNNDLAFLEYRYSSDDEYSLYIDKHPYLVWMGKSKLVQRDEMGKPIRNNGKTDYLYKYTHSHVVVQRYYNGFYWKVSSYEAFDNRQERKRQVVEDLMAIIGQEEGSKTIEQVSIGLNEYMWLTPMEVQSLLNLAALQYVGRYREQIENAIGDMRSDKPRSGIAQQEFSNPLTLSVRYP